MGFDSWRWPCHLCHANVGGGEDLVPQKAVVLGGAEHPARVRVLTESGYISDAAIQDVEQIQKHQG